MNPVKASLHYPQVTLLLTAAVFLSGIYALVTMPRREDPKITIRTGLVIALYPGATAEQVEKQVTRKLEDRLFRYEEVRKGKTWSTSRQGVSIINVELEDHVRQPDVFWSKLRHAMIELKLTQLPEGVQGPIVRDDYGDTVALLLALHGGGYDYQQLKDYAGHIEDEFRTTRAVAKLARVGEQKDEIRITSSTERVSQYTLSPLKVIQALRGRNVIQSGGDIKTLNSEVPLKTTGLFETEDEIRRLMIDMSPTGQPVYLGDLANVNRVEGDPRTLCRFNGERALLISVEMLEGNNIVDFGHELRTKLERVQSSLPPDLKVDIVADQPLVVEERISHFIREFGIAIGSVILVTILLLPFRVALIASLAIPVTVAATFGVMDMIGVELHQVSIAALIVVLGMVVDDAIVIADNYVELLDRGVARAEAAARCATELVVPVLTATATIIAAFLPMLLISGAVGEFIRALPIAVAVALTCSFVVAMLLTPWLCQFFIKQGLHDPQAERRKGFNLLDLMQRLYNRGIVLGMRHKALTLAGGAAAFVLSLVLLATAVPERFFPTAERAQFVIHVWLPEGARLAATDEAVRHIEGRLKQEPQVADYSTFVGESAPRFYYNVSPEFTASNYAQLLVNTKTADETPALVFRLRKELARVAPEARILVRELEQGTSMQAPVEVRIVSSDDGPEDLQQLKSISLKAQAILRQSPGAEYVYDDFHEDSYDLGVQVDEEVANRLGLSNASISMQLAGAFSGMPVTTFWEGDRDVPVVLRLDESYRRSFEDVSDMYVVSSITGARVPLRSVATLRPEWRANRILHRNGVRTLTAMAIAAEHHLPSEIQKQAQPKLAALALPAGYRIDYGGEIEGQRETFGEMKLVMALSIAAIFLILLFQFRSPVQTLVIMMSIPLAMPGAVLGLLLTGNPFSFTAFMGVISLSGVVVRNAIILVEYINERRKAGVELEAAALEAGERRLRPIFLTTAAAAVGVTPMILSGSSLWSPLASVIAIGLICSMFFTLGVVPVLYVVCERRTSGRAPVAALLALCLLGAGSVKAETRKITLEEAVSLARSQNAIVKLAELKVKENRKKRDQVRANYFPVVTNESNVIYTSGLQNLAIPAGFLGSIPGVGALPSSDLQLFQGDNTLGLMMTTIGQPLTQIVKIRAGTHVADQDIRIAEQKRRQAENEIALKTQEAYFGILILEHRIAAARARVAAAEEGRKEARDAVDTGAALEVKALESEALLLQQKNAVLNAETQAADLRTELNDLLGLALDTELQLAPPEAPVVELSPLAALTTQAESGNPELREAQETVVKARHAVAAARAEFIPDISFVTMHTFQSGVPFLPSNNAAVGARMSWNLFDGGKRAAVVGERQTLLQQAEVNATRLRNRVAIDVEKARRKVERLQDMVRVAEKAVAVRREARRIGGDQVELGLATALAATQADAALAEAESQLMEARLGLRLAVAELERTIGR
ncbi:efflux RND transporter permease subunit [uncultured Paludibaculum sp.]|uniref:efflux RND transporter permease subunit n=1 Tax=uncultured Paludibaculum sp. TaxID=1765020 RepID=UPI002AAB8B03|nr:efflux RND transporter permease subunit [uncultured Paludibaculum sp.]